MTGKIMSFILALLLAIANGVGIGTNPMYVKKADAPQFQPTNEWELAFEDNFEGDELNKNLWHYGYDKESIRRGGYWVDDAVFVKDGNLTIRTDYREDGKFGAGWYTGVIETAKQGFGEDATRENFEGFSGKYGYYEIRCKAPKIYGTWAAFWLMPDSNFKDDIPGTGEDGAEIDIFESPFMYNPTFKNSVSHAIHVDGYGDELKSMGSKLHYVKNLYDEFHTYALEWNEDEYIFYVDGTETWRTKDKTGTVAQVNEYMIVSVEVGGSEIDGVVTPGKEEKDGKIVDTWAGGLEKNDKEESYDFVVDYVKVYQKNK